MKGQLHRQSDQRGAVLIVALIMLLVTTFVGFSTMETSNLEAKMATARDLKELTFQTAETSIERGLLDQALISDALVAGLASTAWPTRNYTFTSYLRSSVEVVYLGDFLTEGYSAKKGDSGSSMATLYYTVRASAERDNTNIASEHTQGVYVLQPKAN
ncbi:MAG: PilX N-terminal domain-containing pilus assembly protein [Halieaceae bacterium]|nr:PilX N-terminal domain-containing pilus assembly protein [Halieaceae bacterium]